METKKVTLNNGTFLEVGKKYTYDNKLKDDYWFEVLFLGEKYYMFKDCYNNEDATIISLDEEAILYIEPTPQKEWKTFLIEFSGIKYRAILQYETLEQAQFHHPNAISITEVKINIEEVK